MEDDQQNEHQALVGWILGIAVTIAIAVALVIGVISAIGGGQPAKPAAAAAQPAADAQPAGPAKLYFETGKADLPPDAEQVLGALAETVKSGKASKIVVSGYHDKHGNPEANHDLALQRAIAVRVVLVAAGVTIERIELRKPQETEGGPDDREARRVEVSAE
jgi:outer membrane protein OmpA-like peptidoglycan-associated protein